MCQRTMPPASRKAWHSALPVGPPPVPPSCTTGSKPIKPSKSLAPAPPIGPKVCSTAPGLPIPIWSTSLKSVAAAEGATLFKLVDQIGMGRPGAVEHTFGPIGGAGANDLLGLIGFDPVVQLGGTGGGPTGSAECHAFREAGGIVRWHIEQREELAYVGVEHGDRLIAEHLGVHALVVDVVALARRGSSALASRCGVDEPVRFHRGLDAILRDTEPAQVGYCVECLPVAQAGAGDWRGVTHLSAP